MLNSKIKERKEPPENIAEFTRKRIDRFNKYLNSVVLVVDNTHYSKFFIYFLGMFSIYFASQLIPNPFNGAMYFITFGLGLTLPLLTLFLVLFKEKASFYFRKITIKDLKISFMFAIIEILNGIVFIYIFNIYGIELSVSKVTSQLSTPLMLILIPIQILGEQLIIIGTFLVSLKTFNKLIKSRFVLLSLSLTFTGCSFGLLHLTAYDWNVMQCIFLIGVTSIWQIIIYIYTRNIWVSFLTHVLYDVIVFSFTFIGNLNVNLIN